MAMDHELAERISCLEGRVEALAAQLRLAFQYVPRDPSSSLTKCRIVLEKMVLSVYSALMEKEPKRREIGYVLNDHQFARRIPRRILSRMNSIRDLANLGPHGEDVDQTDAHKVLSELCDVLEWYCDEFPGIAAVPQAPPGRVPGYASVEARRREILRTMLEDPKYDGWRSLRVLTNAIGADEETTKRLLLEIGARGSTDGKPLWCLISDHPIP